MTSVFDDVLALRAYILDQIAIESHPPKYNGTQRVIAYRRVLVRLDDVIQKAMLTRATFNFTVLPEGDDDDENNLGLTP